MDMFITAICLVVSAAAFGMSLVRFMHFFQLNTYRAKIQFKWMKTNYSKLSVCLFFGILLIISSFIGSVFGKILFFAVSAFALVLSMPKKAKKPLVFTMRVKRMIVTLCIVYTAILTVGLCVQKPLLFSGIMFILSPLAPMLANLINTPIELAIKYFYTNDAKKILKNSNAKVIGITGSYGKTSVKYFLATLLKAKYNVLMTPESYNTPMGVVKTIRESLSPLHEVFVCEMGAKRVGEIDEICDIVNPSIGIITSVGPQHLETFKTLDNVKKTKFELADALPNYGTLFLNGNDENINEYKGNREHISYSVNSNGSYNASDIHLTENGTAFTVTAPNGEKGEFTTKLIGTHNVLNITGAIAVAHSMGISFSQLKFQVMRLESVPHRLELIKRGDNIIIDDAFNSNPSGAKAALDALSCFDGLRILVTPGMVELGEKQDELNREFGENAASKCDYAVLVGRRQTESIKEGLLKAGFPKDKLYTAQNLKSAVSYAYSLNTHGKKRIILLENDLPDNY